MRRACIAVVLAALLAGCGNDRAQPPDLGVIPAPKGFRDAIYRAHGIAFRAPTNWRVAPGEGTHLATVAGGDGQIAVFRYPRSEPLPLTRAQLRAARDALVAQITRRDASFSLTSSRLVVKRDLRAVEIVGTGANLSNDGVRRSMRSLHAYGHGAEVVIDATAPPKAFTIADRQTFAPVARSLRLSAPRS